MNYGIHAGMSFREYAALPAVNHSSLRFIARSPAHYLANQVKAAEETDAQRLGTMIHTYVLEPKDFPNRYVLTPDLTKGLIDKNGREYTRPTATTAYRDRRAQWLRTVGSRQEITSEELETCDAIDRSLRAHPAASALLEASFSTELVLIWRDEETGLDCKARLDYLNDDGVVADLKSTVDASPGGFARAIADHDYYTAAAWYLWGLACVGASAQRFLHVAVEKDEPHAVGVYELADDDLDLGLTTTRRWLTTLAECKATNNWPAYSGDIQPIRLPGYKRAQMETR